MTPLLAPHGFKYMRGKKQFKRKTAVGEDYITIFQNDHLHYEMNLLFQKRIDRLAHLEAGFKDQSDRYLKGDPKTQRAATVGFGRVRKQIVVINYDYFAVELVEMLALLQTDFVPMLDELNDLERLHQLFNAADREAAFRENYLTAFMRDPFSMNSQHTALAAAYLVGAANYEELLQGYLDGYAGHARAEKERDELRQFDAYLKTKPAADW